MIRLQRWTPDTCANPATGDSCVLIESWDDSLDPIARTHNFVRVERLCSHHAAIWASDGAGAFAANYDENRRKNMALSIAQTVRTSIALTDFTWSFDASRLLTVSFAGITSQQKTAIQNACNLQYGPGKVLVQ